MQKIFASYLRTLIQFVQFSVSKIEQWFVSCKNIYINGGGRVKLLI